MPWSANDIFMPKGAIPLCKRGARRQPKNLSENSLRTPVSGVLSALGDEGWSIFG